MSGIDGFAFRAANQVQSEPKTGASRMMKTGFTDWSQLAGISQPRITRSVKRSAKRFIEEPACSNPDQKSAARTKSQNITPMRRFSRLVCWPNRST